VSNFSEKNVYRTKHGQLIDFSTVGPWKMLCRTGVSFWLLVKPFQGFIHRVTGSHMDHPHAAIM